jgi:hypothetical protein
MCVGLAAVHIATAAVLSAIATKAGSVVCLGMSLQYFGMTSSLAVNMQTMVLMV